MVWQCKTCTFINQRDTFLACAVCGAERDDTAVEGPLLALTQQQQRQGEATNTTVAYPTRPAPIPPELQKTRTQAMPQPNRPSRPAPKLPTATTKSTTTTTTEEQRTNSPSPSTVTGEEKKDDLKPLYMELIESERVYVNELELIVVEFYQPLMIKCAEPDERLSFGLRERDITPIFSNIKELLRVNIELLRELEKALAATSSRETTAVAQGLSDAFTSVVPHLKMYSIYAISYEKAIEQLRRLETENARFATFLQRVSSLRCPPPHLPLSSYLIKPVQRICKYPLFFKAMLKTNVASEMGDGSIKPAWIESVERALEASLEATEKVNAEKQRAEDGLRAFEISARVDGLAEVVLDPGRRYRGEWKCMWSVGDSSVSKRKKKSSFTPKHLMMGGGGGGAGEIEKKSRTCVLFSDAVMVVKEIGAANSPKLRYSFKMWISLDQLEIGGIPIAHQQRHPDPALSSPTSSHEQSLPERRASHDEELVGSAAGDSMMNSSSFKSKFQLPLDIVHVASSDLVRNAELRERHLRGGSENDGNGGGGNLRRSSFISLGSHVSALPSIQHSQSLDQMSASRDRAVITTYRMWFRSAAERARVDELLRNVKREREHGAQAGRSANGGKSGIGVSPPRAGTTTATSVDLTSGRPRAASSNDKASSIVKGLRLNDDDVGAPFISVTPHANGKTTSDERRRDTSSNEAENLARMSIKELRAFIAQRGGGNSNDLFERSELVARARALATTSAHPHDGATAAVVEKSTSERDTHNGSGLSGTGRPPPTSRTSSGRRPRPPPPPPPPLLVTTSGGVPATVTVSDVPLPPPIRPPPRISTSPTTPRAKPPVREPSVTFEREAAEDDLIAKWFGE